MSEPLRLLIIGAHPDDAEYRAGGLAALYRRQGHEVRFLSLTDGSAGHHRLSGAPLIARRRVEASDAAESLGISWEIWDEPDGRLVASLACRERLIRTIRRFRPDLVLTHRPNDYHPDHRATSLLVQDSAYLLTVPALCADVPHLPRDPVIAYLADDFQRPYPFEPSVVVDVSSVWDQKIRLLHAHASQFYEWLPYNRNYADQVPENDQDRLAWLSRDMAARARRQADRLRPAIISAYGVDRGETMHRVEAFEGCEYGVPLDLDAIHRLFPFASPCRASL
jgi:LmbE family N-acetylglucosaminyl deacetylase